MRIIISIILFSFLSLPLVEAQLARVTSGFSRDTIVMGEEVEYSLSIRLPQGVQLSGIQRTELDSVISVLHTQIKMQRDSLQVPDPVISDHSYNDYGKWNDANGDGLFDASEMAFDNTQLGSETLLENTFKLTFWDAGPHYIKHPRFSLIANGDTLQQPTFGQAAIMVKMPYEQEELTDSLDIVNIRPIITEEKNITDYFIYFYMLAALLGAVILIYLMRRFANRKQEVVVEEAVKIIRPAHEKALEKLQALKESKLWEQGQVKEYQSELTYTIREYLENRFDIKALEATTEEIVQELKEKEFSREDENDLREILQVADLVKFAKAKPDQSIHERFLNTAFDFVGRTKKVLEFSEE